MPRISHICLLFIDLWGTYSWHAYDKTKLMCDEYKKRHDSSNISTLVSKYKLWPVYNRRDRTENSILFGTELALEKIWEHQHPKDCSKVKFLISNNWAAGFGSEFHVFGAALGLSMNLGRVFLQHPYVLPYLKWQTNTTFCARQSPIRRGLECYFEPWSSCTIFDALGSNATAILRNKNTYPPKLVLSAREIELLATNDDKTINVIISNISLHYHEKSLMTDVMGSFIHGYIPISLLNLVRCSPMIDKFQYYWWRSISIAYLLRPNIHTLNWMSEQRQKQNNVGKLPPLHIMKNNPIIGVYVRKGDKYLEMKTISLRNYKESTYLVWYKYLVKNTSKIDTLGMNTQVYSRKRMFLATEDSRVLRDMIEWAESEGWDVYYTNLFNRAGLSAEMPRYQKKLMGYEIHHDLEYLSMLLNIDYLLRCSAWVCALRSNFCRIIDELRATVGGKLHAPYADLSIETCAKPPCIGDGIKEVDWR